MQTKSLITMAAVAATMQFAPAVFSGDPGAKEKGSRHHEEHFANLAPDEREKMKAAHEKAIQDPAVQAAHNKVREARRQFKEVLHSAMLKADPSIQPILDKMHKGEKDED
jgi:hypothetical protein